MTRYKSRSLRTGVRQAFGRHDNLVAFAFYLLIALLWYHRVIFHMHSLCAGSTSHDLADNSDFTWWLAWVPYALSHGISVLHTTAIWAPTGLNMANTTATLLLALVAAPVTLIWGPLVSYNVMMIIAPVLAAWAAYRLCKYVTSNFAASLMGGAMFGFSTYEVAHLVGQLPVAFVFCVPLSVLCVLKYLHGVDSPLKFVVKLTIVLTAQIYISVETLFTMTAVGLIALLAAWVIGPAAQRRKVVRGCMWIALAYFITFAAASWYLRDLLSDPLYAKNVGLIYPTDALSFFIPAPYTWVGGDHFAAVSDLFRGGSAETNAYIGLPIILIMIRYITSRWSLRSTKILLGTLVATVFWVLGPRLYIAGKDTLWLPFSLFAHLPLFEDTMEGRVALYLGLLAALILALWLSTPRAGRKRWLAWGSGAVAVIAVLPNLISASAYTVGTWPNPTLFKTDSYKQYLQRGETILPIPWGIRSPSTMWLAEDNMYYRLASGYWLFTLPSTWHGGKQIMSDLGNDQPSKGDGAELKELLIEHNVAHVVVQDNEVAKWSPMLREAGLPQAVKVGGVALYTVPASWRTQR